MRRLREDGLRSLAASLFQARGMSAEDAARVAEVLVWADLRGGEAHGVSRIPHYFGMIDKGALDPRARPAISVDLGAAVVIDGGGAAGAVAASAALREAMARAGRHGVGLASVGRATHAGAMGFYAEAAARAGFAAIVMAAGPPLMAYQGAAVASVSTAPLACAVPGGPEGALVFDMASSRISNGRLKQARRDKESLPEGWALDADGRPATRAQDAAALLPMGGPKGAGLALMIECLSSLVAGAPILAPMLGAQGRKGHGQSATIVCLDVARLRGAADYAADVDALAAALQALPRADRAAPIRMPGARSAEAARRNRDEGIAIDERVFAELIALAQTHGVATPDIEGERT